MVVKGGFDYDPRPTQMGQRLWVFQGDLFFSSLPRVAVPVCMTVLGFARKQGGVGLALWSAFPATPELIAALGSLVEGGVVDFIIAPNAMHTLGAESMKEAFPDAKLLASPGAPKRCPGLQGCVEVHSPEADLRAQGWPWDEVPVMQVEGLPLLSELVALHRPSRSLILTDTAFNFCDGGLRPMQHGLLTAAYIWATRAFRPCCVGESFWFMVEDPAALRRSFEAMLEWDFDQIIFAHGRAIRDQAAAGGEGGGAASSAGGPETSGGSGGAKQALRQGTYAWACWVELERAKGCKTRPPLGLLVRPAVVASLAAAVAVGAAAAAVVGGQRLLAAVRGGG